ncbi:MAG TPA: amidohydrolase family protein [Planctomycetota bacterium]
MPLVLALLAALAPSAAALQSGDVAVRAGRVILADGREIENGTVLVRGGKITAVGGADLEIPFDVVLHEHPDAVVFSGFKVAYTTSGLDRANENVPVGPFLDVRDSLDPSQLYFEEERRNGVVAIGVMQGTSTVIAGLGRVVAPHGMTVGDMTLRAPLGHVMSFAPRSGNSRSAQMAELREAEAGLLDFLRRKGQELVDGAAALADAERAGEDPANDPPPLDGASRNPGFVRFGADFPGKGEIAEADLPEPQRSLVRIFNGDRDLWVWAPTATDVVHANDWLSTHGLLARGVFLIDGDAWKASAVLAAAGRPVVLAGDLWHVERDPVTWKEIKTFVPKVLADAGIAFSLTPQGGLMDADRLAYLGAVCVREGVPRATALAAVTSNPAAAWKLAASLGGIAAGADGTFAVLSGDPLDPNHKVLEVWLRGERIYERSTDERLQRLLEGTLQ